MTSLGGSELCYVNYNDARTKRLRRELRKVQLQSQIAAVRAPAGMEKRLDSLEKTVSEMAELVVWLATPDENSEEDEFGTGDAA